MRPSPIVHIVEDHDPTRRLLATLTEQIGYDVASYGDGPEAHARFEQKRPDIVISDWKMPGMTGLDICRSLRDRDEKSYTYFILISAQRRSRANLEQAVNAGVDDFLKKPLSSDELWTRLRVAERILKFNRQVERLESLIPICSYCKKIRNDDDLWEQVEKYMGERTGADFTHSICPACIETHIRPGLEAIREKRRKAG